VFDLVTTRPQPQQLSLSVRYQDECCTATVVYLRSVDLLSQTAPTHRFLVSIVFKYLGEVRQAF
jgi:hypothetical protein